MLLIVVLLLCGITVKLSYKEELFVKASYLCFTIFKTPAKKSSTKAKDRKEKKAVKKKVKKERKKLSFSEILQLLKCAKKPAKKIMKRIKFSHVKVDITAGGADAAKAALNFGTLNIAVGNALGAVDSLFTLKSVDDVHIDVDFYQEETKTECYFEVRLSAGAALAFILTFIIRLPKYLSVNDVA